MSKRYSESLTQDLNNGFAESLQREWDFFGQKDDDNLLHSNVDFLSGKTLRVLNRKNQEYLLIRNLKVGKHCHFSSAGRATDL